MALDTTFAIDFLTEGRDFTTRMTRSKVIEWLTSQGKTELDSAAGSTKLDHLTDDQLAQVLSSAAFDFARKGTAQRLLVNEVGDGSFASIDTTMIVAVRVIAHPGSPYASADDSARSNHPDGWFSADEGSVR